jgi:hypothetical protein
MPSLTVGLPGHLPGSRRGCHVPHGRDPAGVGAPCTPGRRCSRGWLVVTSRRLPLSSGQPCPRPCIPSPGVSISRHQWEFASARPSGFPLACGPRMERALLGFSPDAPTLPLPAAHVRAGTDLRTLIRSYAAVTTTTPPSSVLTRTVRLRVAPRKSNPSLRRMICVLASLKASPRGFQPAG